MAVAMCRDSPDFSNGCMAGGVLQGKVDGAGPRKLLAGKVRKIMFTAVDSRRRLC